MRGLLYLERWTLDRRTGRHGFGSAAFATREDLTLGAYRGFDGQPWPDGSYGVELDADGLVDPRDFTALSSWAVEEAATSPAWRALDLIFVTDYDDAIDPELPEFVRLGVDVGYRDRWEDRFNQYSAVLHEVTHNDGQLARSYRSTLNEHGLFPDSRVAWALIGDALALERAGASLCSPEEFRPLVVFGRPDRAVFCV